MTQDVSATFYAKIGGLGTSSGLYRFTTREAASGDVPILLDVPSVISSRMEPLRPIGSDEAITLRLAYETSDHASKVRQLVADPSSSTPVRSTAGGRPVIQLTESVGNQSTSIKLTSTVGLSTGTLYYLGGEAITFSAFPDSTTGTATRGVLSPYGGGYYHDAPDELGPVLTSSLPTGAGQRVEFGRIVDGVEQVLFRGRVRDDDGTRLIDGTVIELDVVSCSSVLRNAAVSPPQGVWVWRGIGIRLSPIIIGSDAISYDGGIYILTDDNGPADRYLSSSGGYIHIIDDETGDFATFEISGFGAAIDFDGRPAKQVQVVEGDYVAAVGNKDGFVGIGQQAYYDDGLTIETHPEAQLRFADDIIERTGLERLRVELAISADNLAELFERVLFSPSPAVAGMSAQLVNDVVEIPASVRAGLLSITNTLDGVTPGFILPPFEAEQTATHRFFGQRIPTYRGRARTLSSVIEGNMLKPWGLSLLTTSDGTIRLVDWVTQPLRFDGVSLDEDDLADINSEQVTKAGPSAPVIAVVPPKAVPLHNRGAGIDVESSEAKTIIVKSSRPVTSMQIQAMETVETKHAAGSVAAIEEIAIRMQSAADVYGLPRPEIVVTYLGGSSADDVEPGTYYTVSHPDVAQANGQRGLTNARAVCIEKSVDVSSGSVRLRSRIIGHSAQELATWAPAGIITSWLDPALTLSANVFTDSDALTGPTTDAQAFDLDLPTDCQVLDARGEVRGAGTVTARSGNTLTFSPAKGLVPAAGDIITVVTWGASSGEWLGFATTDNGGPPAFGAGIDDALGGVPGDPAQRYR